MDIETQLEDIVGPAYVLRDATSRATYGRDWLADYVPAPRCVVRPRTTAEVSAVVRCAALAGCPVVPSGGRTGLSGGAVAAAGEIVLSLERMTTIYPVDTIARTVRCEAGTITERIQSAAADVGLLFPIDFASRGSSQIGGNIATNAGGIRVLRYGNTRDWVLGLTVVTGTGEILELNGDLFKNNTGYDLRALMCGSEGTLAVITEAILKLTDPLPPATRLICALPHETGVAELLLATRARFGSLTLFEYFSEAALDIVLRHSSLRAPFPTRHPAYVLIDIPHEQGTRDDRLDDWLNELAMTGAITDAVIARSSEQARDLLALRESISATLSAHYTIHKNDIAVPVPRMGSFLAELHAFATRTYPEATCVLFGHVADGNIHVNIVKPPMLSAEAFITHARAADAELFALVRAARGTVSAEHGVGLLKRDFLEYTRSPTEIELMRGIKRVFDPRGILNPGKIFPPAKAPADTTSPTKAHE